MCFDTDALPPDPARTGMLAASERTILAADDGNRFAATIARTREPASAGVAIIPDVRGLHRYYERLAEHLADAGVHAVAIDPYGRTAGAEHREDGFDYAPHRAAATRRRDPSGRPRGRRGPPRRSAPPAVVSMGFCFGGRASLMQASQESVDGVIAFYGPPTQARGRPALAARRGAGGPRSRAGARPLRRGGPRDPGRRTWRPTTRRSRRPGIEHRIVVVPGRAALLLRPDDVRARRGVPGRLGAGARVRRQPRALSRHRVALRRRPTPTRR